MSEPFLGEIRSFGFGFAPAGHAHCDGQLLPISQNSALFSLLGTTFGGDGRTTFGLPDMRSRTPIGIGSGPGLSVRSWGEKGGAETHTLTAAETPAHTHTMRVSDQPGDSPIPADNTPGAYTQGYGAATNTVALAATSLGNTGGQAHENMQPFTTINFCIALTGIFPSRN